MVKTLPSGTIEEQVDAVMTAVPHPTAHDRRQARILLLYCQLEASLEEAHAETLGSDDDENEYVGRWSDVYAAQMYALKFFASDVGGCSPVCIEVAVQALMEGEPLTVRSQIREECKLRRRSR